MTRELEKIVTTDRRANLILQGNPVSKSDLKAIAALAQAGCIEEPATNVYKLKNAMPHAELPARCLELKIDYAFVRADLHLSYFRLLAMDMDSTLINIETLDEVADYAAVKAQVVAITERSMNGEVDFTTSLRQRVALLKGLDASALERVYAERVQLNPGAEVLIATCKKHGIKTMLVSGGFTFFTERLKTRLGLDYAFANELEIKDGILTGEMLGSILDPKTKADRVKHVCDELHIRESGRVIAIGDGANDRAMFAAVGMGIAYRAKPILRPKATYCLDFSGLDGVLNLLSQA